MINTTTTSYIRLVCMFLRIQINGRNRLDFKIYFMLDFHIIFTERPLVFSDMSLQIVFRSSIIFATHIIFVELERSWQIGWQVNTELELVKARIQNNVIEVMDREVVTTEISFGFIIFGVSYSPSVFSVSFVSGLFFDNCYLFLPFYY